MPSPRSLLLAFSALALVAACGSSGGDSTSTSSGGSSSTATGGHGGSTSTGTGIGGEIGIDAGSTEGGGGSSCDPPFALIALDRTQTMHKTPVGGEPTDGPDYQSSKFYQAITAIEKLTAS